MEVGEKPWKWVRSPREKMWKEIQRNFAEQPHLKIGKCKGIQQRDRGISQTVGGAKLVVSKETGVTSRRLWGWLIQQLKSGP